MRLVLITLALLIGFAASPALAARVEAKVDLSQQKMRIYQNGRLKHVWAVSTGRRGYSTPTGRYGVKRMHRKYYSRKYNNAPMPHSIFFRGGYAIHGTNHIKRLGRVASHGCIRLHPSNAQALFNMVRRNGTGNFRVSITH